MTGCSADGRYQPVAGELEILLVFAALDLVRDAVHVVQAVEGGAGAAQPDQLARLQHLSVAQHVERAASPSPPRRPLEALARAISAARIADHFAAPTVRSRSSSGSAG